MATRAFISLIALGLPGAGVAQARPPEVLAPIQPWNLHYAENSCQLIRTFGDPANPTTLALERLSPDGAMTALVFGGKLSARQGSGSATFSFLPVPELTFPHGQVTETVKDRKTALFWASVGLLPNTLSDKPSEDRKRDLAGVASDLALTQANAGNVAAIEVREPRGRPIRLQTGSMAKANALMRECAREQLLKWGLDPAVQDKIVLAARAERNLASFLDARDYPVAAIQKGQEALISVRLIVGADGRVTGCTPLTRFTGEGFKEVVCRKLGEAVFKPAELADGTKVPTFVTARIYFRMP